MTMNNIDPVLRSDLERISEIFPHWEELAGKSILITGASGLVGSMLVRTLCAAPVEIAVIAHVRNEQKARAMFGNLPVSYCVGDVTALIDRQSCRLARAPQSFVLADIIAMHKRAMDEGYDKMIDSASLMIHYGRKLHLVEGPAENIKITTPSDFYIFKAIREARENMQILGI